MHWRAPKIVVEYVPNWSLWLQITVVFNSTDIIEDEITVKTVVVRRQAC